MKSINDEIKKVEKEFEDADAHANLCEFESCPMCVRFFEKRRQMKTLKEVKKLIEITINKRVDIFLADNNILLSTKEKEYLKNNSTSLKKEILGDEKQ